MERYEIPFWEKYTLSIEEAAAYFRIGENKIRKMINDNRDADYILWNNTRAQIKRKKFENYIDRISVLAKCQDKITKNYKKFLIALKTGVPLQVGSPFSSPPRRWRCKNGAKNWPAPLGVSGLVVFPCSAGQAATVMYSS